MITYVFKRIGFRVTSDFNSIEEILALSEDAHLTFDGAYDTVWQNREALRGRNVTLFFCWANVGKDNKKDLNQPYGRYLEWEQLFALKCAYGFKLGYNSFSYRDLVSLTDEQIKMEITPPFPMDSFAYPYGSVNKRVANLVQQMGYKEAYALSNGDGSQFSKKRAPLNW